MSVEFKTLLGKTLKDIEVLHKGTGDDRIVFKTHDGKTYALFHYQNCCEQVVIDDISGDLIDLLNSPITLAEEVTYENEDPIGISFEGYRDSFTWTFYKLATVHGYVTIRWYGGSNGYYSESVYFERMS